MADGALRGYGVLVTGGGTGIGRACAEALAADGALVTICGRTESSLTDAVDAIRPGYGGSVHHVVADVTSEDDVRAAVAATVANAGSLRGVVPTPVVAGAWGRTTSRTSGSSRRSCASTWSARCCA